MSNILSKLEPHIQSKLLDCFEKLNEIVKLNKMEQRLTREEQELLDDTHKLCNGISISHSISPEHVKQLDILDIRFSRLQIGSYCGHARTSLSSGRQTVNAIISLVNYESVTDSNQMRLVNNRISNYYDSLVGELKLLSEFVNIEHSQEVVHELEEQSVPESIKNSQDLVVDLEDFWMPDSSIENTQESIDYSLLFGVLSGVTVFAAGLVLLNFVLVGLGTAMVAASAINYHFTHNQGSSFFGAADSSTDQPENHVVESMGV